MLLGTDAAFLKRNLPQSDVSTLDFSGKLPRTKCACAARRKAVPVGAWRRFIIVIGCSRSLEANAPPPLFFNKFNMHKKVEAKKQFNQFKSCKSVVLKKQTVTSSTT